ncbi:hypothetical protein [Paludisphaera mucosa]|uniref:Uncharacterized protein n=1 Tax=Paludisphaera mucosa TaxID=3030827 RepID=A0ABT6FF44_9BACT|nr:hypothetical protein [Paludisphaera mucosa]MDG3006186.1 hypothetical protein [Paludisphaera mucosa]
MKLGRRQRFGTQYHKSDPNQPKQLDEVGPGVTDVLRREMNAPTLDEARNRAAEIASLFKIKKS